MDIVSFGKIGFTKRDGRKSIIYYVKSVLTEGHKVNMFMIFD